MLSFLSQDDDYVYISKASLPNYLGGETPVELLAKLLDALLQEQQELTNIELENIPEASEVYRLVSDSVKSKLIKAVSISDAEILPVNPDPDFLV